MKMILEIIEKTSLSPSQPSPPSIPSTQSNGYALNNRISPSILLIIIILAVIFFISGLLHLVVRFLLRPAIRNSDEIENLTALQGQLQQLFHLHDSGVDQSFIDSLPIFNYKAIVGVKDPFDCAVCLSEFEVEDELRLLPKCSHAFHVDCIDTWLLSHSTCPICRANLAQDINHGSSFYSPVVRVLESGRSETSREIVVEREANSHLNDGGNLGQNLDDQVQKSGEVVERECGDSGERVVAVKLGKFRNVGGGDGGGAEARRCFSMGSFAYVLDENSLLKVAITSHVKKQSFKKQHRTSMSECGCDSRREEFGGFDLFKVLENQSGGDESKPISISKRDSFSVSKIWLSGRRDKAAVESSRRAFSFRLPAQRSPVAAGEAAAESGGGGGWGLDFDEEIGMQNKVVCSSFSRNV